MEIYVYECFSSDKSLFLGTLFVDKSKRNERYSFEFSKEWLSSTNYSFQIDPDIQNYNGRQFPSKDIFGIFSDSCPDRWGRTLINRQERITAYKENRKPKELHTSDYLLRVFDETRCGALRFKLDKDGPFLSTDPNYSVPPWATLRNLEEASRQYEIDENILNENWLKQLLRPGSSLGGARPKANISAPDGSLWIAKFPSKNDEWNIGAWEKVASDLAKMCKLNSPQSKLVKFSDYGSTFLVKRFDRDGKKRLHFSSSMTLLGKIDGEDAAYGSSYLDIASFIKSNGSSANEDLQELWKRVVFNMAVSNTDDHLRNHGFILTKKGWRLSPLYDVNPTPFGSELSLNVNNTDNAISLELAIESAPYYNIDFDEAVEISNAIITTVNGNWERLAKQYNIEQRSIEFMRPSFGLEPMDFSHSPILSL